jgi:hypothetical protein
VRLSLKESRMKFGNAMKIHRKSGVRWGETWGTRFFPALSLEELTPHVL